MRLIDADALRKLYSPEKWFDDNYQVPVGIVLNDIDAAPTVPQWISVDDGLPQTAGTYLVYAPTYSGGSSSALDCIDGIMFSRWKNGKWSIEHGYYKRPNCVEYWQPLPEPPERSEE